MPAPSNISWPTALDLGAILPISTTQEQSFGGTTYNTYYTFTVPAGVFNIGPFIYGNFTTWNPVMTLWRDPLGTPVQINGSISGSSVPEQALVIPGETIGIISTKPGGNPTPALTTISVIEAPTTAIANGNLFQNDVSFGYPAVVASILSGDVVNFTEIPFAYGQYGRILASGVSLYSDDDSNKCILYDASLIEILKVAGLPSGGEFVISTDQVTGFWVTMRVGGATHAQAYFVNSSGVVTAGPYDMGASTSAMDALAQKIDNSALYFLCSNGLVNRDIRKITIPGLVITVFIPGEADKIWSPRMMTMTDDSLVVGIGTLSGITFIENFIRRYNSSGVLLDDYDIGASWFAVSIFAAIDDPLSFWVYAQPTVSTPNPLAYLNRYINIRVSDGVFLHDFTIPQFIDGVSQQPGSLASTRFGTPYGGAPNIIRAATPATPGAGLYVLTGTGNVASGVNPVLRHDNLWVDPSLGTTTNIAIANPFAMGYLVGDE